MPGSTRAGRHTTDIDRAGLDRKRYGVAVAAGARCHLAIRAGNEAWLRVLSYEAKSTAVIIVEDDPRTPICFIGVTAFVRDDFLREMKTAPLFWVGPELARRVVRGESPFPSDRQLRRQTQVAD